MDSNSMYTLVENEITNTDVKITAIVIIVKIYKVKHSFYLELFLVFQCRNFHINFCCERT